jgi:hypothetical protein
MTPRPTQSQPLTGRPDLARLNLRACVERAVPAAAPAAPLGPEVGRGHDIQPGGGVDVARLTHLDGVLVRLDHRHGARTVEIEPVGMGDHQCRVPRLRGVVSDRGEDQPPRRQAVLAPLRRGNQTLVRTAADVVGQPFGESHSVRWGPTAVVLEPTVSVTDRDLGVDGRRDRAQRRQAAGCRSADDVEGMATIYRVVGG